MSVVLDASVVVALIVVDVRQGKAQAQLTRWLEAGEELHAPGVLPYEVANVLARLRYDGFLNSNDLTEIWRDVADLELVLHPFGFTRDGPEVGAVTDRLRSRHATDSTYICLAQRLGTTMWTLDGALARNAADIGLPVQLLS